MEGFRRETAVSLVELMVVIAVVGVLVSIAVSNYRDYIIDGCRGEAGGELEKIANIQEQYYFDNNVYSSTVSNLGIASISQQGHYKLATGRKKNDAHSYYVTAVQNEKGGCLPDYDIQFRLDNTGLRERNHGDGWVKGWKF